MTINELRKRIPYGYWLFYDGVIGGLLLIGAAYHSRVFLLGFPFLALAALFDVVEYLAKRAEL
jgi:hypothetical protein